MFRHILAGVALLAFLVTAHFGIALAGGRLAFLLFAAFNLLLAAPSTRIIRWPAAAIAVIASAYLPWTAYLALLLVLVWPFAMLVAWGTTSDRARDVVESGIGGPEITPARSALAAIVAAVAVALVMNRALVTHHLEQSAALFVGAPALLAIVVILFVSPKSATGVIFKAVTIALLLSALFLWEGVLCVVMAAPVFYAIAAIIGTAIDQARRSRSGAVASCLMLLALVPLSLEDTGLGIPIDHREVVTATRTVKAPAGAVAAAILSAPRFDRTLPPYLRAGFPRPIATTISPDHSEWIVRLRGGEMKINGMEPRAGDLVLTVVERGPESIRWQVASDGSHLTHFLFLREAEVEWRAIDAATTEVTWRLAYDRNLAPAWYFGPWERYATRLAAGYLIDAVATP